MENATKALLIAAAVLVVILVIALGMRIMNSAGDVSGKATEVGGQIGAQTNSAASSANQIIQGIKIPATN